MQVFTIMNHKSIQQIIRKEIVKLFLSTHHLRKKRGINYLSMLKIVIIK
jgi:hypothetical protein